jgi:hypothetical protein
MDRTAYVHIFGILPDEESRERLFQVHLNHSTYRRIALKILPTVHTDNIRQ